MSLSVKMKVFVLLFNTEIPLIGSPELHSISVYIYIYLSIDTETRRCEGKIYDKYYIIINFEIVLSFE